LSNTIESVLEPEKLRVCVSTVPFEAIVSVKVQLVPGTDSESVPDTVKDVPMSSPVSVFPSRSIIVRFCPTCVTVIEPVSCCPGKNPGQSEDSTVSVNVNIPETSRAISLNVAVTDMLAFMVSVQEEGGGKTVITGPQPLKPAKVEPAAAVAVRVTEVPARKLPEQFVPQSICAGLLVTVPLPVPVLTTLRVKTSTSFTALRISSMWIFLIAVCPAVIVGSV
jgi:hypothetical protein